MKSCLSKSKVYANAAAADVVDCTVPEFAVVVVVVVVGARKRANTDKMMSWNVVVGDVVSGTAKTVWKFEV